jgi:hypothetical protein
VFTVHIAIAGAAAIIHFGINQLHVTLLRGPIISGTQITTTLIAITSLRHAGGLLLDHRILLTFSRT